MLSSIRTIEFHWALIVAFGVMVPGCKPGTRIFRPISPEHPKDDTFPDLLLLRPEVAIFFANAPRLGLNIRTLIGEFTPRVLILHLSAVPYMEYTALTMLTKLEEQVR